MTKSKTGTKEWAESNYNIMNGCQHGCKMCYAQDMAIRFKRSTPQDWCKPVIDNRKLYATPPKKKGRIMYPSAHDIHPDDITAHCKIIWELLESGNELLIVSKPHLFSIKTLCYLLHDQFKDQITFRFTIGSKNENTLKFWEPYAPGFEERIDSLVHAFDSGFKTSISCEPMLDGEIHKVVEEVEHYVTDTIWLGKANKLKSRLKRNGYWNESEELLEYYHKLKAGQTDEEIRKLYDKYKDHPKIRWKDSIKKVLGMDLIK